ncbi:thioester reductase [Nocardia brasiliensis]|uniref:Thioester reductase n=1 Tax=Nocardia brasiliensis TaxID=37326 RepID=A0A6G9XL70_NOCBR|nr:condensation domain-containing protein [Nocardia brasiliensis]QIS01654.1 thioester reductase [Nocardia brasiliensis]
MSDSLVRNVNRATTSGDRGTPLSLAQQAVLLPERLRRTAAANLFVALEVTGDFDDEAFEQAAIALLAEHEILRTVFPDDRRVPYQRVLPVPDAVVETVRIEQAALDAALRSDAVHRFDLVHELPIRLRRYALSDRTVVSLTVHPVAADDRTLDLLATGLFAAYEHGQAEPAGAQYRSLVAAQLKALGSTATADPALAYWTTRLANLPDRATPILDDEPGAQGPRRSFRLARSTFDALRGAHDASVVFAALVARTLAEAGIGDDVLIGLVEPGQTPADPGTVLGNIANQLVLRLDSVRAGGPRELVDATAACTVEARANAQTRIEQLTHQLKGTAAVVTGALFQALIGVRADGPIALSTPEYTVREVHRRTARPHGVDLTVDVAIDADGVTVTLEFPALSSRRVLDDFAAHLERRCAAWATDTDTDIVFGTELFIRAGADGGLAGGPGLGGAPQTDAERVVAAAIRKVLELDEDDEVGRADTFFSLGGDSIAALRLVTDLGEQGYVLDVQTVFAFPTVHELATQLTEGAPAADAPAQAAAAPMSASGLDPAALAALGKKFGAK